MPEPLNVVFLMIDSLRADHLGCYHYDRPTSPFMDELAAGGVLAECFIAPGIPTHPSFTTMQTGQHPITHGIVSHGGTAKLAPDAPNLAQLFTEAGYATCGVDNLWRQRAWFGVGFEYLIDPSVKRNLLVSVTCDELNGRAIPWIREHATEPFYLQIHYWDPHSPYNAPAAYRHLFYNGNPVDPTNHTLDEWWDHPIGALAGDTWLRTERGVVTDPDYITAMYDQSIRYLDDGIRNIVGTIDELGLAEKTLIVLVADHGESMTEHGIFFDHYGLHDAVLRVPMLMRLPGRLPAGARLAPMLQHTDLAPTLLEAAALPVPSDMDGRSFWKIATGEQTGALYDEVVSEECTWQAAWSLRTERYKLIVPREPDEDLRPPIELYDLSDDPHELHNMAPERQDVAVALEHRLTAWIDRQLSRTGRSIDPLLEQGVSLGAMLRGDAG